MPIFRGKEFISAALDSKDSARAATRSNINLQSLVYSVDDVVLKHKDRILLAGQTISAQNGIYTWNSITAKFTRSTDADSKFEVSSGLKIFVEEGTQNGQTNWTLTTPGEITIGTTNLTFFRENRVGNFDQSGTHGTPSTTNVITLDESGQITSITPVDIALDGGEF